MSLKCMFWNVRNLTETLARPGRKSGGLPIDLKINEIIKIVVNYDVSILMEIGVDGDKISEEFKVILSISGFFVSSSRQTGLETYIVIAKIGVTISRFKFFGNPSYRQAVAFNIRTENGINLNLCAMHAPSPGYLVQIRKDVISKAVLDFTTENPNIDAIFLGDLNFKTREQAILKTCFQTKNDQNDVIDLYRHTGPGENTSLRTYVTIINEDDIGSQPYDQVWFRKRSDPPFTVENCNVLDAAVSDLTPRVLEQFIGRLPTVFEDIFAPIELQKPRFTLSGQANVRLPIIDGLRDFLESIQTVSMNFNKLNTSIALNFNDIEPIVKIVTSINKYFNFLSMDSIALLKDINTVRGKGIVRPTISINSFSINENFQQTAVNQFIIAKQVEKLDKSLFLTCSYLYKKLGAGVDGLIELNTAAYEYAISDHFPVEFTYDQEAVNVVMGGQ